MVKTSILYGKSYVSKFEKLTFKLTDLQNIIDIEYLIKMQGILLNTIN